MVVFKHFSTWSKPLVICAATGFLWSTFVKDKNASKDPYDSLIRQAELFCQAYKEKQGIPGRISMS